MNVWNMIRAFLEILADLRSRGPGIYFRLRERNGAGRRSRAPSARSGPSGSKGAGGGSIFARCDEIRVGSWAEGGRPGSTEEIEAGSSGGEATQQRNRGERDWSE